MYYSKTSQKSFLEGEPFIRKHFGKDAEKILENSDLPALIDSIKKLMKHDIFEQRTVDFDEIESALDKGHVPLVMIDWNVLYGKQGYYEGHFVVVTGYDGKSVFYHESGPSDPEANKKAPRSAFIEACNANGTDNDVVMVFGKRINDATDR